MGGTGTNAKLFDPLEDVDSIFVLGQLSKLLIPSIKMILYEMRITMRRLRERYFDWQVKIIEGARTEGGYMLIHL